MITLDKGIGDVFAVEYNQTYNRKSVTITAAADTVLEVGTPVSATGIAKTDGTDFIGFSLGAGTIKKDEIVSVATMENGFGVVVIEDRLPTTFSEAIKTKAIAKGFKFLV